MRPSRETIGERSRTHGMSRTREYRTWVFMRNRCFNRNAINFERYGGRGITVCERWKDSFSKFFADMGARPPGMSLDRINNDGNYEPANCKWSTPVEQTVNRRARKDGINVRKAEEDAAQIRELWRGGMRQIDIARKYKLCREIISYIIHKRRGYGLNL